jgi:hypothetical protein
MDDERLSVLLDYGPCVVYVPLNAAGPEWWRPTPAEPVGGDVFRIVAPDDYAPDQEDWKFAPGSLVRCKHAALEDGEYLIAVSLAA